MNTTPMRVFFQILRAVALPLCVAVLGGAAFAQNFKLGATRFDQGDYPGAFGEFQPLAKQGHAAAQQGHAEAQFSLGELYRKGRLVRQNRAQAQLGTLYYYGYDGVQQDYAQEHDEALYNLGEMYEYGYGVASDMAHALVLYQQAAQRGNYFAQRRLEKYQRHRTPPPTAQPGTRAAALNGCANRERNDRIHSR